MDIQIQDTPPKRARDPYSTPPHSNKQAQLLEGTPASRHTPFETPPRKQSHFQTPRKSPLLQVESATKKIHLTSGIKPKQNPQSRKYRRSPVNNQKYSPCQSFEVSPFHISRLDQDYELIQQLGSGHFSDVGLFRSRISGELFAIKTAKANRMSVNEVQALGSIWVLSGQCPNVVRYYHSWIEDGQLFLVMEYCQQSLQRHIARHRMANEPLPEKIIVSHLRAALLGLASIHKHGILHLDVKPENLLFKGKTLKIADFGLSRAARFRNGDIQEGDSRYLAREVLNIQPGVDLTKADIFSLAMTAYQMLTLESLPNNGPQWLQMREEGLRIEGRMDLTGYSSALLRLVERMGAARWSDRPSALQLLQQDVFKQSQRTLFLSNGKSNKKRESSL